MSESNCTLCGKSFSVRSLYDLNGAAYCVSCVQDAARQAKERGQPSAFVPLINKSICARCNTYIGSAPDAVQVGALRFCAACGPLIKDWDYPQWLKMSLAALLLLLVVALAHGRKYFHAGREMYVGERLVAKGRYTQALPHLQETLRIAPNSDKAVLLTAKAALLSGDVETADKALQAHSGGHFEDANNADFKEVESLWNRATGALTKAEQAAKLEEEEGKEIEAARLMHEAATAYPEAPGLAAAAEYYDSGAAFARKDYDSFVAITRKQWNGHSSAATAAGLAGSLACEFAVTGDSSYRQQAEEMLAKAQQMAQGDADALKNLEEYLPRIRYRLDTRKIITKKEYDRRFRSADSSKK
ncbi:MAG TPA: tetratricopeptide repeat protein [Candidatus Acidoferrum sp.]|nr:tetratricopeptide repeat protein [Candidatus Acidoferrum sp.]